MTQKTKKKFNWKKFAAGHVAVHLQTPKEAMKFSELLHKHGYSWRQSGSCLTYPHCSRHMGNLCFYADGSHLTYGDVRSANAYGNEIWMFSAYDFEEE